MAWRGELLCGHEFIKFVPVNFSASVVKFFLDGPKDGLIVMVLFASTARLENRTPIFTQLLARFFVFYRMTVFIGNSAKAEHLFLGAPGTKTKCALRKSGIFFCLCPREIIHFFLQIFHARGSQ